MALLFLCQISRSQIPEGRVAHQTDLRRCKLCPKGHVLVRFWLAVCHTFLHILFIRKPLCFSCGKQLYICLCVCHTVLSVIYSSHLIFMKLTPSDNIINCLQHLRFQVKWLKVRVIRLVRIFVVSTLWLHSYPMDSLYMRHKYNPRDDNMLRTISCQKVPKFFRVCLVTLWLVELLRSKT